MAYNNERMATYRTYGRWYAFGWLDAHHIGDDGPVKDAWEVASDFGERVARKAERNPDFCVHCEWTAYAGELQQMVVVVLGEPSDDTYGLFQQDDDDTDPDGGDHETWTRHALDADLVPEPDRSDLAEAYERDAYFS
jgi:hypothetical protein